jgi:hypothetical protein
MEEIMEIISEYAKLHKDYEHMNISSPMPEDWADTLTIEKVADMRSGAEWLVSVAQQFVDKLDELEATLQPRGYREQEVYTIGQYIMDGYTPDEAVKVRNHDIIWNRWVNGQATPNEIAQMDAIAEELGL